MSVEKNQHERRKYKRYKACSGVFAVNSQFGLIVDISIGGLAFNYVEKEPWPHNSADKGALYGEDEMWIDNMPIRSISKGTTEKGVSSRSPVIKKRRVVFAELPPAKRVLIEKFISINAR
jgi:hypothetical protein